MLKNALLQCDLRRAKTLSRYLIPAFIFFWILFLYPNNSPAFASYSQTDDTSSEITHIGALFQTFSNLSGIITKVRVSVQAQTNPTDIKIWFTEGNENTATSTYANYTTIASTTLSASTTKGFYDLNLNYELNSAKFYGVIIQQITTPNTDLKIFGSTNDNYAGGQCYEPYGGYPDCEILKDFYFVLETGKFIQIDFPPNATSTPDFNYWGISGDTTFSTSNIIHINWGVSTSTLTSGFTNYFLDNAGTFSINAPKSFTIPAGTYYARAWLATCAPYEVYSTCIPSTWTQPYGLGLMTPLASSTLITFTITGENPYSGGYYGTYYPAAYPTSTATSSEWVITCDPNDPLWQKSLCQVAKWSLEGIKGLLQFLFVPKQEDLVKFNDLKNDLQVKPPIGYFYQVKNALEGFNSTSTPAFDLPQSAALSDYIFNPLRTGISFILWLTFGFWVFKRIKNLEL